MDGIAMDKRSLWATSNTNRITWAWEELNYDITNSTVLERENGTIL